jgi:ribonuclease HI
MGAFYYPSQGESHWSYHSQDIDQIHAFTAAYQGHADEADKATLQPGSRGCVAEPNFDINIYEVKAILLAFQTYAPRWRRKRVYVYTDSKTAAAGLRKSTLHSPANRHLRTLLLLAAELDILIAPRWVPGENNELADALSRFDSEAIANICPHWQNSLHSMLLPHHG